MDALLAQYQQLLTPSDRLLQDISKLDGEVIILGASGKMGPDLALLVKQAFQLAGLNHRVSGVARFTDKSAATTLAEAGIDVLPIDLLDAAAVDKLPAAPYVLYLAGTKFGTVGHEPFTWAMNTYVPALVAQRYKDARIVVFSTGNVYPLTSIVEGGATELTPTAPIGEYAQSCLGRERMFQFFSDQYETHGLIYRLNYANDVSYGVLLEIAQAVFQQRPIDVTMGYVNVIWQGDANEYAVRCLLHGQSPMQVLNITGPETLSVRELALKFGRIFGLTPILVGEEADTALLSNASKAMELLGPPLVSLDAMVTLIAEWVKAGGKTRNKPTHFQERHGQF